MIVSPPAHHHLYNAARRLRNEIFLNKFLSSNEINKSMFLY